MGNSAALKRTAKPESTADWTTVARKRIRENTPVKQPPTDTLASSSDVGNLTNEQLQDALSQLQQQAAALTSVLQQRQQLATEFDLNMDLHSSNMFDDDGADSD